MLFLLNETFTNGFNYNLLTVIWLFSILCGVFIIISKNPVVSFLFLVGLFLNIEGYLMMLGTSFIGLSYLSVYVGAVSALLLFILVYIKLSTYEFLIDDNDNLIFTSLAFVLPMFLMVPLYKCRILLPSSEFLGSLVNIGEELIILGCIISTSSFILVLLSFNKFHIVDNRWLEQVKDTNAVTSTDLFLYVFRDPDSLNTYPGRYLNFLRVNGDSTLISTMLKGDNKITYALVNGSIVGGILLGNTPSTIHPIDKVNIQVKVPNYNAVVSQTSLTSQGVPMAPQYRGRVSVSKNATSDVKIISS